MICFLPKINLYWHSILYGILLNLLISGNALTNPFPNVPLLAGTESCDVGPMRSASGLALSTRFYKPGALAFHASYQPGTWSGDLIATDISTGDVRWQLSKTFNGVNANFKDRPIFRGGHNVRWIHNNGKDLKIDNYINYQISSPLVIFNDDNTHYNGYVKISTSFNTTYESGHFNYLSSKPPSAIIDMDTGNYLRGDQSKEDGIDFRIRSHPIGDIVHSTPAYAPGIDGRKDMVYVGANDGMLHGIEADTGKVVFSYIPRGIDAADLVSLKDPNYEHRFFVDGHIHVYGHQLLGSLGRGGRGIFSLNVSDPENIELIFDFTAPPGNTDIEPNLGHILNHNFLGYGHGLFIPNGIGSPNGAAELILGHQNKNYQEPYKGSVFFKSTDDSKGNGLISVAVAVVSTKYEDYVIQRSKVYVGDLKGNIWVLYNDTDFDFSNLTKKRKVFEGNPSRPISGLAVARREDGKVMVGFGTGSYLFEEDRASNKPQRLYGIIDDGQTTIKQADLTQRTLNGPNAVPVLEPYQALPAGSRGWYIDLAPPEQVTHSPVIISSGMYVNLVSPPATAGLRCDQVGPGSTRTVAVNIFTGTAAPEETPYFPATQTDGITSEGMATTLRVLSDATENGKTYLITNTGTLALPKPVEAFDFGKTLKGGRLMWREILR